jgi:two-component system response regulator YesN
MISVVICEDETFEREALKDLIHFYFKDQVKIVGEAENGRIALNLVELFNPDIVIMDIHIPVLDGLTVSRKIREHHPDTEILISTAYSQFDYARKAITIGVFEYLVKPATPNEFFMVMQKLIEKILNKRTLDKKTEKHLKLGLSAKDILEHDFILHLMGGQESSNQEIMRIAQLLEIEFCSFMGLVLRITTTVASDTLSQEAEQVLSVPLRRIFKKMIVCPMVDEIAILLIEPRVEGDDDHVIREKIQDGFFNQQMVIGFGISELHHGVDGGLLGIIAEARTELFEVLNIKHCVHDDDLLIIEMENRLYKCIVSEDIAAVRKILEQMILIIQNSGKIDCFVSYPKKLLIWLDASLNRFFRRRILPLETQEYLKYIDTIDSADRFLGFFLELAYTATNNIAMNTVDSNEELVKDVQSHIRSNVQNRITVAQLSENYSISEGHLRKIFRQYTGLGIKEYLIETKMKAAEVLLREKGMMVKEVAATLGFTDQNYFSRAFKEHFGIAPRDYINR